MNKTSLTDSVRAMYSASQVSNDTDACLLELQKIGLPLIQEHVAANGFPVTSISSPVTI